MHISKLELENIKSYESSTFEFSRGTTAITGENGAGKTTIIEAIAWALFDLLEYKKDDFVRRGAKKGSVTVTFESSLDEREYIVYRDTGAGYHVTDPRLQTRIADKKEEVFRFLWQHLGLEPGTDLKSLFRQAIGVPQGTFTAIFLEGATERKVAFDRLLKVEEYRQAADKLRETSRYLDQSIAKVRENIARAEGELLHSERVIKEYAEIEKQSQSLSKDIEAVAQQIAKRQSTLKTLDEQERRLSNLKTELQRCKTDQEKAEIIVQQAESALMRSSEAVKKLDISRSNHELHIAALTQLNELDQARRRRDELRAEHSKIEAAIVSNNADRKSVDRDLQNIQTARQEIEKLREKASEQMSIDKDIDDLRNQIAAARTANERIESIENELARLRVKYSTNEAKLKEADDAVKLSRTAKALEERHAELLASLAKLRANLELDEKFQSGVREGLCPIFSARCLNLEQGGSLDDFISGRAAEMRLEITALEKQSEPLTRDLMTARESQKFQTAATGFRDRKKEIEDEGTELQEKKAALDLQRQELGRIERQMTDAETRLKTLADPAARIRVLEKQLVSEKDLQSSLKDLDETMSRLSGEHKSVGDKLEEFKGFNEQWTRLIKQRDNTAADHHIFIANEAEAGVYDIRKLELGTVKTRITQATTDIEKAKAAYAAAAGDYDPERHKKERDELQSVEHRSADIRATFEAAKRRESQLQSELEHFSKVRKTLESEFKEKERLESVAEATGFIRDTLKEAAPRVARNYVYHVSLEANQMFREITGNAERTLKWVEDYSIVLEEEGFERPFQSLSGGEQMAAALSVRLALLKQLTDIRIAFFDEPTTNMDAERRENLAQQISRITHFDQLFVISHDETFDSYVDNVIALSD